jgi:hypothetical protein
MLQKRPESILIINSSFFLPLLFYLRAILPVVLLPVSLLLLAGVVDLLTDPPDVVALCDRLTVGLDTVVPVLVRGAGASLPVTVAAGLRTDPVFCLVVGTVVEGL